MIAILSLCDQERTPLIESTVTSQILKQRHNNGMRNIVAITLDGYIQNLKMKLLKGELTYGSPEVKRSGLSRTYKSRNYLLASAEHHESENHGHL